MACPWFSRPLSRVVECLVMIGNAANIRIAVLGLFRAMQYENLTGQDLTALTLNFCMNGVANTAAMLLATFFCFLGKYSPELLLDLWLGVDVLVDSLTANPHPTIFRLVHCQATTNLFGAPAVSSALILEAARPKRLAISRTPSRPWLVSLAISSRSSGCNFVTILPVFLGSVRILIRTWNTLTNT